MTEVAEEKYNRLVSSLALAGNCLLAYSGGVDSTLLLRALCESGTGAPEVGGAARVLAVTAVSASVPPDDLDMARKMTALLGVRHELVHTDELNDAQYVQNTPERCFFCKSRLFKTLREIAQKMHYPYIFDGSNADDRGDYRPGLRANVRFGIRSPLMEAGLTKDEIRLLSHQKGLPTHDRASSPCLSSRLPYGEPITLRSLQMVREAEAVIKGLGFTELRVRKQAETARIELMPQQLQRALDQPLRQHIVKALREIGFQYVTLDMEGFSSGKLNRVLSGDLRSELINNDER
ncbi:PP-loop domain-containing protein [Candidatus Magnetobacterium bavaricum]|uniref:PP-loop domain-containing protein n=1 Tax=Candidatus Magnetobacterium bavaricum TaxID=29290 RepID=A0A0F3GZ60_9BACT|nr:PP-loop domain-containing protein [Candidatus Magnetobacterium bavaricum]